VSCSDDVIQRGLSSSIPIGFVKALQAMVGPRSMPPALASLEYHLIEIEQGIRKKE
jgi:hypothetical protein